MKKTLFSVFVKSLLILSSITQSILFLDIGLHSESVAVKAFFFVLSLFFAICFVDACLVDTNKIIKIKGIND
jgi:hypothetical protein